MPNEGLPKAGQFHGTRRRVLAPTLVMLPAKNGAAIGGTAQRAGGTAIVVERSWPGSAGRRLQELALPCCPEFLAGPFAAVAGKTIKMARRTPGSSRFFPACFEPAEFIQAHEYGVKGAGGNTSLQGDGVAVVPAAGMSAERLEDSKCRT